MKRIIGVTGYKGKIGSLLMRRANFVKLDCDITEIGEIASALHKTPVDIIVNCAALSGVDYCESHPVEAFKVNVRGLSNLHDIFGKDILNISSDQVFSGDAWWPLSENKTPKPINTYGYTKLAAEGITEFCGGKTIRLSRSVSLQDADIAKTLELLELGHPAPVPDFFYRNYLHREFVADGIEYMANNWETMPNKINYGGIENWNMFIFTQQLVKALGFDPQVVTPRRDYTVGSHAPRPKKGGLSIKLATSLGFPMKSVLDTVSKLVEDYHG